MHSQSTDIFLLKNPSRLRRRARKSLRTHTPSLSSFRSVVWGYWRKNGRHDLPWRKTTDPYKILVSEVMLQQTQVSRVKEKYKEFLKAFPNLQTLAKAPLADVLRVWSGLGYNRRGKFLRDAAITIVEKHNGRVPLLYGELVELPGVGDYTARAVRVFAFNEPDVLMETNIRTALIHHFGSTTPIVSDSLLLVYAKKAAKGQDPREWHWALMDYGSHLKRSGVRNNKKSAHYARQSRFEGSLRQARGAILRELQREAPVLRKLPFEKKRVEKAFASLIREGFIVRAGKSYKIA